MSDRPAHIPVMAEQVVGFLARRPEDVVLDVTVGLGGHARLLGERLGPKGILIGLDLDPGNLEAARGALAGLRCRVELGQVGSSEAAEFCRKLGIPAADAILADLGVSSTQLDDPVRGFSFQREGPLDMRMDPAGEWTAADIVNEWPADRLADLFFETAQERRSRRIAKVIERQRQVRRIETTTELADIVVRAVGLGRGRGRSRIHPATKTFLALRMAVNQELEHLERFLLQGMDMLSQGGRMAILAFHGTEDRIVKRAFRDWARAGKAMLLSKKPLTPDRKEQSANPRARSAKLRALERVA